MGKLPLIAKESTVDQSPQPAPPSATAPSATDPAAVCSSCAVSPAPFWGNMSTQSWIIIVLLVFLGLQLVALKLVWETKARLELALSIGWQRQANVVGSGS